MANYKPHFGSSELPIDDGVRPELLMLRANGEMHEADTERDWSMPAKVLKKSQINLPEIDEVR
jgi:hypothetical protein